MEELDPLDRFDLGTQGDRHEREFWPLLSSRFPCYEILWRRLIVPLTNRVDPRIVEPQERIRFRTGIPEKYEKMAMAHYSGFYFLGRASKRLSEERTTTLEYPEDVLFLLDSVGDNFKQFLGTMNELGRDCGCTVFDARIFQFPKGFEPFQEISDYRDTLLHNAVIGRGIDVRSTYIPKWNIEKSASPLERAKMSWRMAEQLSSEDRVSTTDLLERLISESCATLERYWRQAITAVATQSFEQKIVNIIKLAGSFPLRVQAHTVPSASSSSHSGIGSNTTWL